MDNRLILQEKSVLLSEAITLKGKILKDGSEIEEYLEVAETQMTEWTGLDLKTAVKALEKEASKYEKKAKKAEGKASKAKDSGKRDKYEKWKDRAEKYADFAEKERKIIKKGKDRLKK